MIVLPSTLAPYVEISYLIRNAYSLTNYMQNNTFTNGTCSGGHGLSIGSVGGRTDNVVQNVLISSSTISNSMNGVRIKTVSNTTGSVSGTHFLPFFPLFMPSCQIIVFFTNSGLMKRHNLLRHNSHKHNVLRHRHRTRLSQRFPHRYSDERRSNHKSHA